VSQDALFRGFILGYRNMARRPKYEVRRGFFPPTVGSDEPQTATYEVWRRQTLFNPGFCVEVFRRETSAQGLCNALNGRK
jgi:hypothetical protein